MKHKAEIAGAVAGAGVFMAGYGLARLITSPFRGPSHEIEASKARMAQPTVIIHEHTEVNILAITKDKKNNRVIDMGEVEEYDCFDPNSLHHQQQIWDNNQRQAQEQQNQEQFFQDICHEQTMASGGYPWQQQARRDAEKQKKKENSFLSKLLRK